MSWVTKAFTWGGTRVSDPNPLQVPTEHKPNEVTQLVRCNLLTPCQRILPHPVIGTMFPTPQEAHWDSFLQTHLFEALPLSSPTGLQGEQNGIDQEPSHLHATLILPSSPSSALGWAMDYSLNSSSKVWR